MSRKLMVNGEKVLEGSQNASNVLYKVDPAYATMQDEIDELSDQLKSIIITRKIDVQATVNASSPKSISFNAPVIDGYKPLLAIYGENSQTTDLLPVITSTLVENDAFSMLVKNVSSSTYTSTFSAYVIYVRDI